MLFAVPAGLDPAKALRDLVRARRIGLFLHCAFTFALVALAAFGH